jgi:hypothetical protein
MPISDVFERLLFIARQAARAQVYDQVKLRAIASQAGC